MKKQILVAVKGIENENLSAIAEVERAINTIKRFASRSEKLTQYSFIDENAELDGKESKENNLYVSLTVEVEGLENIMGNIAVLTAKLKAEIEKMDKAIIAGIENAPVKA